ncbi:hypothetical protein [Desulfocurvibacter africanus]|uniref:hypothetical protein n=1 Tax=Desulfocurvibacter africanus TaxID=873 RepID=UPI000404A678|nr:hypothetical protein [Desulfocurvibacter africanus]
MSGNSDLIRARLSQAQEHLEQAGQDRSELERAKYRHKISELRASVMELSAHPQASNSDRLLLRSLQSTLGRLGNNYPLTSHGRQTLRRVERRESCATRIERGCPND